jgi:hypothetical protein
MDLIIIAIYSIFIVLNCFIICFLSQD